jgi:hypothetical protein
LEAGSRIKGLVLTEQSTAVFDGKADPISIPMFLQACFGALIGVIAAMAIAHAVFPPDGPATSVPPGLLPEVLPKVRLEPREKGFYLLSLLLGPLGGILATGRLVRSRVFYVVLGFVLLATIPLDTAFARRTLQGHLSAWIGLAAVLILAIGFGAILRAAEPDGRSRLLSGERVGLRLRSLWIYSGLLAALTLIVVPSSFEAVAVNIGLQYHPVSFIIGPSLYFLGHGLLPGIDYYAQYGIGLGWVFSFFPGDTDQGTLLHYVVLVIAAIWVFYAHLLLVLRWLYGSWFAAAIVAFLSLILLFHLAFHFVDPSSTVLRYPLLTVCAALLASWVATPENWLQLLALALAVAGALFLETETGIIAAIAVALGFVTVSPWRPAVLLRLAALGLASLALLVLLVFLVFGRGALTLHFVTGWIEPLTIYGVMGFGGGPIFWTLRDWHWLYNFVAPGSALATLAVTIRAGRDTAIDRPRTAVLVYFAASGLLMMAKFINQSSVGVWQMNALGLFVVMGWWGVAAARALPRLKRLGALPIPARAIAAVAILAPAADLAATTRDNANPSDYGLQSWLKYPALALAPFHSVTGCTNLKCLPNLPDPRDVELIRDRVAPGVPVAIVGDLYDWTYLIEAHRPPAMPFLPSDMIFTEHQLGASLKHLETAEYCFFKLGLGNVPLISNASLRAAVLPIVERDFIFDGVGFILGVWKRRH